MHTIREYIPEESIKLVRYSASDLIERLGKDVISNVVESVLCGGNLRHLTEGLTQRRILVYGAGEVDYSLEDVFLNIINKNNASTSIN